MENVKTLLNKRNKAIRFADKSPAGWTAVEEYESDELADDSEDEKKLRSAERRALSKLGGRKQNRSTNFLRSHLMLSGVIVLLVSLFVLTNSLCSPFEVISNFGVDNHSLPINASRTLGKLNILSKLQPLAQQKSPAKLHRYCQQTVIKC